jgi:cholest-4-en-3-one 26-monooxygenase
MTTSELDYTQAFAPETYGAGNPDTYGLPLDLYEQMRAEMPCVRIYFDHPILVSDVWCLSRHADIAMLLTDKRFISSDPNNLPVITIFGPVAPPERPGIFCQDGETLRQRRKEIGGALRPTILKRLEPELRALAARLVDQAVTKGTVEFISEIAHPLPTTAIGDVLGIPEQDRAQFYKWSDSFISPFDERMIEEAAGGLEALIGIWDYALKATALKRECPADDVLTALALSDATDGEIQGDIATFAAGAGETTRAVLGHAIHELMGNPELEELLRRTSDIRPAGEISYVKGHLTRGVYSLPVTVTGA